MKIELYQGDCLIEMDKIADNSVDAIIADWPYGTTAIPWDTVIPFIPIWEQCWRVLKPKGAIALFGSQPFTSRLVMCNLRWFRYEWIWEKPNGTGHLNANRNPMKAHESILVFYKKLGTYRPQKTPGEPYVATSGGVAGVTRDKTVGGWETKSDGMRFPKSVLKFNNDSSLHPTQKPVALLEYLVRTYTYPDEIVLDNTMGSGTTGVACANTGRNFIGIEFDPDCFAIAQDRIQKTQNELIQMELV